MGKPTLHTEAGYLKIWERKNTRQPSLADYLPCMGPTPADTRMPPEREQPRRTT